MINQSKGFVISFRSSYIDIILWPIQWSPKLKSVLVRKSVSVNISKFIEIDIGMLFLGFLEIGILFRVSLTLGLEDRNLSFVKLVSRVIL